MRLNVYLQKAGVGSRREAERLIADNRVSVNGVVAAATQPVEEGDTVTLDGKRIAAEIRDLPRLFRLNKPVDVLVTNRDPKGRRTVFDLDELKRPGLPRLMAVGRLDVNSEGLLLLSSDGPLAQTMMSPATALARVYRVRAYGRLPDKALAELAKGVTIDGIAYRGGEFIEEKDKGGRTNSWYRVRLTEGKNREIRKIFEHYGCRVNRLVRLQYGPFLLEKLEAGELREVPRDEVRRFMKLIKANKP